MLLNIVSLLLLVVNVLNGAQWPIPYERVSSRPPNNPYCQPGLILFCPTGQAKDSMIFAQPSDTIEIFALKKPVWSFKFGDLMAKFKIMHDALGFRSQLTGKNWTMEWYELDQLFNCTFPHVLPNDTFIWCNQGALCVYEGIVDSMWNGSSDLSMLKKIGETSGVFYETWSIWSDPGTAATLYFDSYDCASFVIRSLNTLSQYGVQFYSDVRLNYTRLNIYSQEPELIGTYDYIIQHTNSSLKNDFIKFYRDFDSKKPTTEDWLKSLLQIYESFFIQKRFYFYYNDVYWYLRLKATPLEVTFDEISIGEIIQPKYA
ncbi:unnamed protein product [Didymodactylos carnosus]|uniref:Bis(monoacylglycero)phosphate synthase CLN5 n=1 Tax=Didymodactylos carnosus TaxID=1234261 RepID=A0A814SYE6_9BILA|nr:unnamed protein product [Didymodactylos carnosus]CAF3918019.1 unnamed protein product [Didymodactylos carnosus]